MIFWIKDKSVQFLFNIIQHIGFKKKQVMTHCINIDEKIHLGCGSDCKVDVTDRKQRDREEAGGVLSKNKAFPGEELIKTNVLHCIQMYPDE